MSLEHTRIGSGPPLLLVHGVGSRREAWGPVLPLLAEHRDVIAVDLPGFGMTPLRRGPGHHADRAGAHPRAVLRGHRDPAAARGRQLPRRLGRAGARQAGPRRVRHRAVARRALADMSACTRASRSAACATSRGRSAPASDLLSRIAPLRMALSANVFGRPWKVPRQVLVDESIAMSKCEGYDHVLEAAADLRFAGGMTIDVPVTIAFGHRDVMLGPGCRLREELPAQTRWLQPRGWGHMPTYDDPRGRREPAARGFRDRRGRPDAAREVRLTASLSRRPRRRAWVRRRGRPRMPTVPNRSRPAGPGPRACGRPRPCRCASSRSPPCCATW